MLILPLPARPDWSRPPLVTLAIMLLCLIAFLMQGSDQQRYAEAWRFYQQSGTAKIELAAYQDDLKRNNKRQPELQGFGESRTIALFQAMEADRDFMLRLRRQEVITPSNPEFETWRKGRARFDALRARIVTENYALNGQEPRLASLFSHMFLHGDIMHLSGNMAVLFVVGYTIESALGPLGFLALYLLGGLGAALPDLLLAGNHRLSLGASGAISAVMAAYLVLFGRRQINFFYWLIFFFGTLRGPALAILPLWLGNELLQYFVLDRDGHVNYLAHFAGLLSGAVLIGLYRWRRHGKSADSVHKQDADQAIDSMRRQAEKLVTEMQFGHAALHYKKLLTEYPQADTELIEAYLRIARLARQPELLADAELRLLMAGSEATNRVSPLLLAETLAHHRPKLSARRWDNLLRHLIDGKQLDCAEGIVLRLLAQSEIGQSTLQQASRLAEAFFAAGQIERGEPLRRLLASRATAA
ncbi:MAG: rhomboid family intramembrane serine protease [Rhodocyclales bacterium GT-UBC]|nr:MAG: rhomboid family intramembrane serine protease [Rhodocyclales bacterium GT-UBC]